MPAITWTDPTIDLPFLLSKLPEFSALHANAKSGVKNTGKIKFYNEVFRQYIAKFPKRFAEMKLTRVGVDGTAQEREKEMLERIKNWFGNHLTSPTAAEVGKKEVLDLSEKTAIRREQVLNAYWRIHKERLEPLLDADYKQCEIGKTRIAHRNQFLSAHFKLEPNDVKEHVHSNRLNVGDRMKTELNWKDDDEISEEEKARRKRAVEYSSKVATSIRTMDRAARAVYKAVGWNVTVLLGGPDPKRGGKVHIIGLNTGNAQPIGDETVGQDFQEYFSRWQALTDSFEDFCNESTDSDYRKSLSLANLEVVTEPTEPCDNVDSGVIGKESASGPESQSARANPIDPRLLDTSATSRSPAPAPTSDAVQRNQPPAREQLTINGVTKQFTVPHIGPSLTEQQELENARALGLAARDIPGIGDYLRSILKERQEASQHPLSAHEECALLSIIDNTIDTSKVKDPLPSEVGQAPPLSAKPDDVALNTSLQAPSNTNDTVALHASTASQAPTKACKGSVAPSRRSNRQTAVGSGAGDQGSKPLPPGALWIHDASLYLQEAFSRIHFRKDIIDSFEAFEAAMDYPSGKVKGHKLSATYRPPCISNWISSGRDFSKIPPAVRPLDTFIREFETWYRSLQPASCIWPSGSLYPSLTGPDKLEDWAELRKAGPNGTFLVLLALSWISDMAETTEQAARLEGYANHITFVLKTVSSLAQIAKAFAEENKATATASKKRKAVSGDTKRGNKKLKQ